jgi:hypothetical protein
MPSKRLVDFVETGTTLKIVPPPDAETFADLLEIQDFTDAIEWQLCNGWHVVPPEQIGALTDGILLSQEGEYEDDGKIVGMGVVYWDDQYETRDLLAELKAGRAVELSRHP